MAVPTTQASQTREPLHDLALLIRSRYALIRLHNAEEERSETLLRHLADHLKVPFFVWRRTKGLQRANASGPIYGTESFEGALGHVENARFPAIYHLRGLGPSDLESADSAARLAEAARPYEKLPGALILTGATFELPHALQYDRHVRDAGAGTRRLSRASRAHHS